MKEDNRDNHFELLINTLTNERNYHISWLQRKETAAWGALAFYLVGIWSLFLFIASSNKSFSTLTEIVILIFLLIIAKIFFHFIHSQYSSIVHTNAYNWAMRSIVFELMDKKDHTSLDFTITEGGEFPKFIDEELKKQLKQFYPSKGKKHPARILLHLWIPGFRIMDKRRKLNNSEKQEAAIYSLLIFGTLIPVALYLLR